ncbi:MAG: M48 family metalloprotease [Pseudomonadota bacterium]
MSSSRLIGFRKSFLAIMSVCLALWGGSANAQGISLVRDAEIERFLDDYSRPIFKAAGLNPNSIQILLVNDNSFNAFAGGRYMGVNTGLFLVAETPNEVEAVIAHEAGHLAGGHSVRTQDAIANASRPMLLGLLLGVGAIAAGAPDAGLGLLGLGQTIGTANFLTYSRGQESTADQASITYLNRLGKSSAGALSIWRKLRNSQILRDRAINPYMITHPMANDRLSALQTRVEQSPYFDVEDSEEEISRLKFIQAKIRGFLSDPAEALKHYPESDQSEYAKYARAVAYYRQSFIDKALVEINALTAAQPDNPYFHELKGQMLFEFGRVSEAIAPHRMSVQKYPDNALLRINLGRALLATEEPENVKDATGQFRSALLLEPDNAFGWSELARAYDALGDGGRADLATAEARYHWGAKPDANRFARRALQKVERGSTEWRQAMDIILATQGENAPALPTGGGDEPPPRDDEVKRIPQITGPSLLITDTP